MLEQDPDHALHALRLHRLACELQQVLQRVGGVGGFAEVDVQSRRFTGLGQPQLLGWTFFMGNLQTSKAAQTDEHIFKCYIFFYPSGLEYVQTLNPNI